MEKREPLYGVGRNVNSGTENSTEVLQKTGTRTYHMIQQFHSWIYIKKKKKKTLIWKDTCTPMLTAAPLTIAKIWKQPKCPSTDEWIKKMWFTYSHLKVAQMVKNLLAMQETQVQPLARDDPLEKGMAAHSSILAWRIHIQWNTTQP